MDRYDVPDGIANSRSILTDFSQENVHVTGDLLIESLASELAAKLKAPRELVMTKLFGALSIGVQPLADVKTPDGTVIPTSCFFITLLKTGEGKTRVEKEAFKPFDEFQIELDEIHKELMRHYRRKLMICEEKLKALKKELRTAVSNEEDTQEFERKIEDLLETWPECPRHIQLIESDITSEAFADNMSRGNKYAAIASAEGGSVLRSPLMRDAPMLNKLFSAERVEKKRKSAQSSKVVDGRLTLSLDIQPEVFYDFWQRNGKTLDESGFFARCFMTQPVSMIGNRYSEKSEISDVNYQQYTKIVRSYLKKLPDVLSGDEPRLVMKLDVNAHARMSAIRNAIEHESNPGGFFHEHTGYANRLAEKILRLACLLHVFANGFDSDISVGAVNHALRWGMYYAFQHMKIFKYQSAEDKDDELLLDWINKMRNQGGRYIKKNDIRQRVSPVVLRSAKRLNPAIDRLELRGEVRKYMAYKTECVDLMPWFPFDNTTGMSLGHALSRFL